MSSVLDHIKQLQQASLDALLEAQNLQFLLVLFPDLMVRGTPGRNNLYYSKKVNSLATSCDIRDSCGCCSDSPLEVRPYLDTEFGRVYSDPPVIIVGEKSYEALLPKEGWEANLRNNMISEDIILQVAQYFDNFNEEE